MKNLIYIFAVSVFMLAACEKEINEQVTEGAVNLSKLETGQISRYIGFQSICGENDKFEYTGDTLIMEVKDVNGDLFLAEYLSPFSKNKEHDFISLTAVRQMNNGIEFTNRINSKFFNFYGSDTLKLDDAMAVSMKKKNCIVEFDNETFRGDQMGKISSFQIGDIQVKNKIIVSCVPIIEVDGYLLYDQNQLYLNYALYTSTFNGVSSNTITGWKKI